MNTDSFYCQDCDSHLGDSWAAFLAHASAGHAVTTRKALTAYLAVPASVHLVTAFSCALLAGPWLAYGYPDIAGMVAFIGAVNLGVYITKRAPVRRAGR